MTDPWNPLGPRIEQSQRGTTMIDDEAGWQARDSAANHQHLLAMMRERLADECKQREAEE